MVTVEAARNRKGVLTSEYFSRDRSGAPRRKLIVTSLIIFIMQRDGFLLICVGKY